jgi:O-antigen/teichoic acid export membrane protein
MLRSAGAATLSQVWRFGVVFATNLVLRRLVPAGEWGLWGWIDGLFLVLGQARDLGLPAHFVRLAERPYGTFARLEVLWGGAVAVSVFALAPLIARGNAADPAQVVPLIQAYCGYLFLEGLAKVPLTWFEAELRIGDAVPAEMARNTVYAGLAIVFALQGRGAWSLLLGQLGGVAVYTLVLWTRARRELRLTAVATHQIAQIAARGRGAAPLLTLLRGGLPLAGVALLVTTVGKVDTFLLGATVSKETQGAYNFAYMIGLTLLANIVVLALRRALYPALVAMRGTPDEGFRAYHLITLVLVALQVLAAGFLLVSAEAVVALLGGRNNWNVAEVASYLRILAFAPLVQPFALCAEDVLITRHWDRTLILSYILTLGSLLGGGLLLSRELGAIGMAWANLLPFGSLLATWAIHRWSAAGFRRLGRDLAVVYVTGLVVFAPTWLFLRSLELGLVSRFVVGTMAALLATGLLYRRFGHEVVAFFRAPPGS